jgi:hypothetical protein
LKKEENKIADVFSKSLLKKENKSNEKEKQKELKNAKAKQEENKKEVEIGDQNIYQKKMQGGGEYLCLNGQNVVDSKKIEENKENDFIGFNTFVNEGNKNELKIEINMDNIKKDVLIVSIGENDDYSKVVNDFCEKHELNDEKRNKLIRFIENKIANIENKNDG